MRDHVLAEMVHLAAKEIPVLRVHPITIISAALLTGRWHLATQQWLAAYEGRVIARLMRAGLLVRVWGTRPVSLQELVSGSRPGATIGLWFRGRAPICS